VARPLRLEYEGACYHVTSRGNERGKVFFSEADCRKFLGYLEQAKKKYKVVLHSYVLMTNHYHLLIETPEANLSKVMHHINGAYTTYINIKRKRSGHLFQGRYKAIVVDRDSYLGELSRYIHLNPVRAKLVQKPEDYTYSSYQAYISGKRNGLITTGLVLGLVGSGKPDSRGRYRAFVEAGVGLEIENPADKVYGGMILGSADFINEALGKLKEGYDSKPEISHRRALRTRGGWGRNSHPGSKGVSYNNR
jgi:REP element-mobilizing transposase RayT